MSNFKQIITVLSAVFIFFGGFELLLPKSKMEKSMKYILSITVLAIILSLVFGLKNIDINVKMPEYSIDTKLYENTYEYQIEYLIKAALKENGIEFREVNAKVDILRDNSIIISQVEVFTLNSSQEVSDVIKRYFDVLKVSVINE